MVCLDLWLFHIHMYIPEVLINVSTAGKIIPLVTVFIVSVYYLFRNTYTNFPPGPRGYPIIGNLKLFWKKPHIHLTHFKEEYGNVYGVTLGRLQTVVVCSLAAIKEGLVRQCPKFSGRPDIFSTNLLYNGQNRGICFADLDIKYKIKKEFLDQELDKICCENDGLEDMLATEVEQLIYTMLDKHDHFDPSDMLESTILRIMLYLVNGKMYTPSDENFFEIWETFRMRGQVYSENWYDFIPFIKRFKRHEHMDVWERTNLHLEYQRHIINRHKDCYNPSIVLDMVDRLLLVLENNEDMGILDQEDIDHLLMEISGSGFQAVSRTLLWWILYVTTFPDVQDKIYEELLSVVGKERLPRLSDQPYLPYTCAVMMETHRLATVLPFLLPHAARETTSFMGYTVPKDTMMLFNVWSVHHDHEYWKHPMKFDPTRFLKPDGSLYIPDHFLPFGAGLRSCPGESLADIELFIFTTHLVYQLVLKQATTADSDTSLEGDYSGYMLSPKPFTITWTLRDNAQGAADVLDPGLTVPITSDMCCIPEMEFLLPEMEFQEC